MSILPQPLQHTLRQAISALSCHFLPGTCLLCQDGSQGELLCPRCLEDLPLLDDLRCPRCASDAPAGHVCAPCRSEAPHFDQTIASFRYDFPVDRMIKALKYGHQLIIAPWLGKTLAQHPSLQLAGIDLVIALPLHPERMRQRGFNQSIEIARPISQQLGRPLLFDALLRTKATQPQAGLSFKERHSNVRGAFECRVDLSGRNILLVDDVMTTGATLNECARVLKLHGAGRVTVAVAARALHPA
jgi:ComF family protein